MSPEMTVSVLRQENVLFRASGGVSEENRSYGFRPAFRDSDTGTVYPSCFANGQPAPFHLLDGLPEDVVVNRNTRGSISAVKKSIVSGFVRDGRFYTREQAARDLAFIS